jgi:DNA replication protein DnaC
VREAKSIFSFTDIYRRGILKIVPELEGQNYETDFKSELICPKCGLIGAAALFYRINSDQEWVQAGETFNCSSCRDTEALNHYMTRSLGEQRSEIADRLTKEYFLLPESLKAAGFKNYQETNKVTTGAKTKAISYTKSYIAGERYNLLVMGNPGTGKSHLCAAIARTLKEKGLTVGFLTTGKLLSKIKATYQKGAMKTEEDILQDLKKLDLLILDDIGSEAGGNDDWRKGILFEVIESRSRKPTIYTSNLTDTDLPIAVGERIHSRLYDNTQFIDLFTEDFRKKLLIR